MCPPMSDGVPAASIPGQPNQLLPPMSEHDFECFKASIRESGVLIPVEVDEENHIIDGHHRARAAQELGMTYATVMRTFEDETAKRLHIVALNAYRRHLTDAQRVVLGLRIEPDVAERARRRQRDGGRSSGDPDGQMATRGPSRDEVAELVGIGSGRTYERGKALLMRLREEAPDLIPSLESGEVDLRAAKAYLRTHGSPAANGSMPGDPPASAGTPGDAPPVTIELRLRPQAGQVGDGGTVDGQATEWVHVIEIGAPPSDLRKPARLRWLGARIAEALYQAFEGKE